jgi:hypothetical protein
MRSRLWPWRRQSDPPKTSNTSTTRRINPKDQLNNASVSTDYSTAHYISTNRTRIGSKRHILTYIRRGRMRQTKKLHTNKALHWTVYYKDHLLKKDELIWTCGDVATEKPHSHAAGRESFRQYTHIATELRAFFQEAREINSQCGHHVSHP